MEIGYDISFPDNPTSYIDGQSFELIAPVCEGRVFSGWYENAEFTGDPVTSIGSADTGDRTFYARWSCGITVTETSYGGTVTAKVNGETAAMAVGGSTVTLAVVPADRFILAANGLRVFWTDGNGAEHDVEAEQGTGDKADEWSFEMPNHPVNITAIFKAVFGIPDFTLPAGLTTIGENAFEGITSMTVVDAGSCTSIGANAFKGCTGLKQIRLPGTCSIHEDAFDGLERVCVFAPEGGSTEAFCNDPDHDNLIFAGDQGT